MTSNEPYLYSTIWSIANVIWHELDYLKLGVDDGYLQTNVQTLIDIFKKARAGDSEKLAYLEKKTGIKFDEYQNKLTTFLALKRYRSADIKKLQNATRRILDKISRFESMIEDAREKALDKIYRLL